MSIKTPTFVIAEAGVNHNGSCELALKLIEVAAKAGADAVKFQTFNAKNIISKFAPKAEYQIKNTGSKQSQLEMISALELSKEDHIKLVRQCNEFGIEFMSTPFDLESVDLLVNELGVSRLKIGSGDITNAPLLLKAAITGRPIILSTGMSSLADIEAALGVLSFGYLNCSETISVSAFKKAYGTDEGKRLLKNNVTLLQCTTEYPTPYEDVNLLAIQTIKEKFNIEVGLSDHTSGISIIPAAVALGVRIVEKHFTLDKSMVGPDHKASLEPDDLSTLIRHIRQVEAALGSPIKEITDSEKNNINIARRSLVASEDIYKGEMFTEKNVVVKRPGTGISPFLYWDLKGQIAKRNIKQDELIDL